MRTGPFVPDVREFVQNALDAIPPVEGREVVEGPPGGLIGVRARLYDATGRTLFEVRTAKEYVPSVWPSHFF